MATGAEQRETMRRSSGVRRELGGYGECMLVLFCKGDAPFPSPGPCQCDANGAALASWALLPRGSNSAARGRDLGCSFIGTGLRMADAPFELRGA